MNDLSIRLKEVINNPNTLNMILSIILFIYFIACITFLIIISGLIYKYIYYILFNKKNISFNEYYVPKKNNSNYICFAISILIIILFLCFDWNFFITFFKLTVATFIPLMLLLLVTIKIKNLYINSKIKINSKAYPECEKINDQLNLHLKKYSERDIYKINKIHKTLNTYRRSSILFLLNLLNDEVKDNNSAISSTVFLIVGFIVVNQFLEFPNKFNFNEIMFSEISIIITICLSLIVYYAFRYVNTITIDISENKKIRILKKYIDYIRK